jgi:hypothetical protein
MAPRIWALLSSLERIAFFGIVVDTSSDSAIGTEQTGAHPTADRFHSQPFFFGARVLHAKS